MGPIVGGSVGTGTGSYVPISTGGIVEGARVMVRAITPCPLRGPSCLAVSTGREQAVRVTPLRWLHFTTRAPWRLARAPRNCGRGSAAGERRASALARGGESQPARWQYQPPIQYHVHSPGHTAAHLSTRASTAYRLGALGAGHDPRVQARLILVTASAASRARTVAAAARRRRHAGARTKAALLLILCVTKNQNSKLRRSGSRS